MESNFAKPRAGLWHQRESLQMAMTMVTPFIPDNHSNNLILMGLIITSSVRWSFAVVSKNLGPLVPGKFWCE